MNMKSLLPPSILSKAFEFNSELAWKPEDVSELAFILKEKQIAVLGGEVWQKKGDAPTIGSDVYHWSSTQKNNNEAWDDYVDRTLSEMNNFVKGLPNEIVLNKDTYINIEMTRQC